MTNKEAVHILRNTAWLGSNKDREKVEEAIETLAVNNEQPEQADCEFCHVDSDWYVRPIEESSHAVIFGSVLYLKVKGWSGKVQIKYCPMCGRRLER